MIRQSAVTMKEDFPDATRRFPARSLPVRGNLPCLELRWHKPMTQSAAMLYCLIVVVVILFQFGLIAGAPWGPLTQGGRHPGALPASGRAAAFLSVFLLAFMAAAVASAAGLKPDWPQWTGWLALGIQGLSALMNWITPSRPERRLWGPITSVMLALAGYVVIGGP